MSRSRRKNNFCSWAVVRAGEEKKWKQLLSRKMRRKVSEALRGITWSDGGEHKILPVRNELENQFNDPKDGKQRFDPIKFSKGMRK